MSKEQVDTLNQIMAAIDEKASAFKDNRLDKRAAQAAAEKKLLLDLIQDALTIAENIVPKPKDAIEDLSALFSQISSMH